MYLNTASDAITTGVLRQYPGGRWELSVDFKLEINKVITMLGWKFPRPIADQLADDLQTWATWGFRFGGFTQISNLLNAIRDYDGK